MPFPKTSSILLGSSVYELGHLVRVRVSQMAIGFGNEQSPVLVPDPVRDRLKINSFLDCIANEEMSQAMMRKAWKTGNATCRIQSGPGRLKFK